MMDEWSVYLVVMVCSLAFLALGLYIGYKDAENDFERQMMRERDDEERLKEMRR